MRFSRYQLLLLILLSAPGQGAEIVSVQAFSEIAIPLERQAAARVESLNEAMLSAELSARVTALPARIGAEQRRGDLLVELDRDSYLLQREAARARVELAEAGLDMAQLRAERARRLAPDRFVSEDQLLEAETRLRQASAERSLAAQELAQAELALSRTRILAPFDGVVTARHIGVGALAAPGTPLLEMVATSDLEVVAGIAPDLAPGLARAERVEFVAGEQRLPLRLARVSPVLGRGARHREARLVFDAETAPAGSEGRIVWLEPRLALPADFLVQREGRLGVLLFDPIGQLAEFLPMPGADAGRPHATDLDPAALLIVDGRRRVQPGDPVRPR